MRVKTLHETPWARRRRGCTAITANTVVVGALWRQIQAEAIECMDEVHAGQMVE